MMFEGGGKRDDGGGKMEEGGGKMEDAVASCPLTQAVM